MHRSVHPSRKRKQLAKSERSVVVGGDSGGAGGCAECHVLVWFTAWVGGAGGCNLRRLLPTRVPIPRFPPYHLCLPHLKGWFLPILFSPFVFLTNVAALHGDEERRKSERIMQCGSNRCLIVCVTQLSTSKLHGPSKRWSYLCHNISIRHVQMVHI